MQRFSHRGKVLGLLTGSFFLLLSPQVLKGQTFGPNSGSTFSNTSNPGSTSSWTDVSNAGSSDNVYVTNSSNLPSSGNYTDYLVITNFGFSLPSGATVLGIEVSIERNDANGKAKDNAIHIVKGGTMGSENKALNPAWPSSDGTANYGGAADLWSETWTDSDINASDFGIAIAIQRQGGGGTAVLAEIDHVTITVTSTGGVLPIELLSFSAQREEGQVRLNWETASEVDNDFFSIERSGDGVAAEVIHEAPGAGYSNVPIQYSAIDAHPLASETYYRLRQTDFDGQNTVSEWVWVTGQVPSSGFRIWPNPADDQLYLEVSGHRNEPLQFRITDVHGRVVDSGVQQVAGPGSWISIDYLSPGLYLLAPYGEGDFEPVRFIVR